MRKSACISWMLTSLAAVGMLMAFHSALAESAGADQPTPVASSANEKRRSEPSLYPASVRIRNPDNGHEYQRIDLPLSWHTAKRICEEVGGHLASVTSAEENRFIYQSFAATHVCWLGATDEFEEGKWRWVTGEPFRFQKWFAGEPNNSGGVWSCRMSNWRGGLPEPWKMRLNPAWHEKPTSVLVRWLPRAN